MEVIALYDGVLMTQQSVVLLRSLNQSNEIEDVFLHLHPETHLPQLLGTGRNAVVLLATTCRDHDSDANDYRAVKFLRDQTDHQYARASAKRFFDEAIHAKRFNRLQGAFVKFYGWGAIRPQQRLLDGSGQPRDFWWEDTFRTQDIELLFSDQNEANQQELERLLKHYFLQGPFYIQHLCQGTLHELLDKGQPWGELPAYTVPQFRTAIQQQSRRINRQVNDICRLYLTQSPIGRSGYDILNSFKRNTVSNSIRSRAILDIFSSVVYPVAQLHKRSRIVDVVHHPESQDGPLAHRDLKPGNIFFQHDANFDGWQYIHVQLSDLGYVTGPQQIVAGDTLIEGKLGPDYLAPGSLFYRAPEQAELPVEVRVDVDRSDRQYVIVRSSKIDRIELHDWLYLSDIFNQERRADFAEAHVFRIIDVESLSEAHGNVFRLKLDIQNHPLTTSQTSDLQGSIIRATGFQTDGFSLGAMLYDLISGGRNPQSFYTHCVQSLVPQMKDGEQSIDALLERLMPSGTNANSAPADLNFAERRRMLQCVLEAPDFDTLLHQIADIGANRIPFQRSPVLNWAERAALGRDIMGISRLDDIMAFLIKSPRFTSLTNGLPSPQVEVGPHERFVKSFLTDKRGEPIPRDILRIILACMVRDFDGSYYRRHPHHGYVSEENYAASTKLYEDVLDLLSKPDYSLPSQGFPRALQENLLFKLRSLNTHETETT